MQYFTNYTFVISSQAKDILMNTYLFLVCWLIAQKFLRTYNIFGFTKKISTKLQQSELNHTCYLLSTSLLLIFFFTFLPFIFN